MTVIFSPLTPSDGRGAYQWHRGYAASNDHLFPRSWAAYERMASDGQIWCAKDVNGDFLALAYSNHDHDAYEIGGLMVAVQETAKGIGSTITRLTLGHLLFEENPLENGQRVIAHIHALNNEPRALFEQVLKFKRTDHIVVPGSELPGLKTNAEGNVEGDELTLLNPDTLLDLAGWCRRWPSKLKDGRTAEIHFREGISLQVWADAFEEMAACWPKD